jgi:hypothetical protein
MKRVLSGIIIAPITFFIGLCAAAYWMPYRSPETVSQVSPLDKKFMDVRPPLRLEFKKLTERERNGLHGPVKMVREQSVAFVYKEASFDRVIEDEKRVARTMIYNLAGEKIRDQDLPICGNADPVKHIFDQRGLLIERINFKNFDEDDRSITYRIIYNYDAQGNLIELCSYDDEGKLQGKRAYKYKFDAYGNWIEQISIDAEQALRAGEKTYGLYRKITYYKK